MFPTSTFAVLEALPPFPDHFFHFLAPDRLTSWDALLLEQTQRRIADAAALEAVGIRGTDWHQTGHIASLAGPSDSFEELG